MILRLVHRFVRFRLQRLGLESKRMELKDCALHYYEFRHPQPQATLVLLHGLGTSSSTWIKVMSEFVNRHNVFAVDLPGFGFSEIKNDWRFLSLSEQCETMSAFVEHKNLQSFTLIGNSMGGWVAAKYAAQNPRSVERLILINPAGVYYPGVERLQQLFDIKTSSDVRTLVDTMWYRYPWYFRPFIPAIRNDLVERNVPEFVDQITREDFLEEELGTLTMPVTVLWGREDKLLSPITIDVLKKFIPHLEVKFIDWCGHVPQMERPETVRKLMKEILEGENIRSMTGEVVGRHRR